MARIKIKNISKAKRSATKKATIKAVRGTKL